jgi:hypothetical protein
VKTTLSELERTPGKACKSLDLLLFFNLWCRVLTKSRFALSAANESLRHELLHMRDILERWKIGMCFGSACSTLLCLSLLTADVLVGLNRKLQIKPRKFEKFVNENGESRERCTSVQLILKWGKWNGP